MTGLKLTRAATDLGFTGTRHRLTDWQLGMLANLLRYHRLLGFERFHHGDCVGADATAAEYAKAYGFYVISHPPVDTKLRAFTNAHEIREPKPYHDRNDDIVAESHAGFVFPSTAMPVRHSGTWSTHNKMCMKQIPCWVVTPAGCWAADFTRTKHVEEVGAPWPTV